VTPSSVTSQLVEWRRRRALRLMSCCVVMGSSPIQNMWIESGWSRPLFSVRGFISTLVLHFGGDCLGDCSTEIVILGSCTYLRTGLKSLISTQITARPSGERQRNRFLWVDMGYISSSRDLVETSGRIPFGSDQSREFPLVKWRNCL
jgi:hypothetical protein